MANIKYIKYLTGTVLILTLFLGCKNDNSYVIESDPAMFAVFPIAIPVSADGGTFELTITGKEAWTATLKESNSSALNWCTISEVSGTGKKVITVTVTPSTSFVKMRSIIIEVSTANKTLKSKVLQETLVLGEDEVLINGLVWSTKNVGEPGTFASAPDDWGMWYQFNRKVGYPGGTGGNPAPENWPSEYTNDGTNWLPENDPSPEGWRVPTTAEMVELWGWVEGGGPPTKAHWVSPDQTGFKSWGMIVGVPEEVAKLAKKDNLKQLGCLFIPQSGWRTETGVVDRDWLAVVRTGSELNPTHGGMSLGGWGYFDIWGWGDGQKPRAAPIRPVKKIAVED